MDKYQVNNPIQEVPSGYNSVNTHPTPIATPRNGQTAGYQPYNPKSIHGSSQLGDETKFEFDNTYH